MSFNNTDDSLRNRKDRLSYIQDVENELEELSKNLKDSAQEQQNLLSSAASKIQNYIADHGGENWNEGFDDGFKRGYDMALKKGKLDKSDYEHHLDKSKKESIQIAYAEQ